MSVGLLSLIGLIILLLVGFYIPPIQDAILQNVVTAINKGDNGTNITYEKLRIHFPTRIEGCDLHIDLPGDIEAGIGRLDTDIKLFPLLRTDISTERIDIKKVCFRFGNEDSAVYLNASVDTFSANDISVDIKKSKIKLYEGDINGVDVSLIIKLPNEGKEDSKTTGESFIIDARLLKFHDVKSFMSITPVIDTLSASFPEAKIVGTHLDLNTNQIEASDFEAGGIRASYIYPENEENETYERIIKDEEKGEFEEESDSLPWTIRVGRIHLEADEALYALKGYNNPSPGFDARYIQANNITIDVDSFYNCLQDVTVPIKRIVATERCGLTLTGNGVFSIYDNMVEAKEFEFISPGSRFNLNATMGLASAKYPTPSDTPFTFELSANITPDDASRILPSLSQVIGNLPSATPINADIELIGNMDDIVLNKFTINLPNYLSIGAEGDIKGFTAGKFESIVGNIKINGKLINNSFIKPSLIEAKLGKGVRLVPFTITGSASLLNGGASVCIRASAEGGDLAFDGKLRMNTENYDIELMTSEFPIQSFLPGLGISDVTMQLTASGKLFNPLKTGADLNAKINIDKLYYHDTEISSLKATANISGGNASLGLISDMEDADFIIYASGNSYGREYKWNLDGNIRNLELMEFGLTETVNGGSVQFNGEGTVNVDSLFVDAHLDFPVINWTIGDRKIITTNLCTRFTSSNTGVRFVLTDRDLMFGVESPCSLDSIIAKLPCITNELDTCIQKENLNVAAIQESMPKFDIELTAKNNNIISEWFSERGEYFDSLGVEIVNDEIFSLKALLKNYDTPKYIADSLSAELIQVGDSLRYDFKLDNNPQSSGTLANANLWGRLGGNEIDARFLQKNHDGETEIYVGFDAQYIDSTVTLSFIPLDPIIGYKNWSVNSGNFISVDFANRHLDADLTATSGSSLLRFYTDHIEGSHEQENINLQLQDIEISEWLSLNPFATPMKGLLSGNISFSHEGKIYTGDGNVNLSDFTYGKKRVGTFDLGLNVSTTPGGFIHAGAALSIDSLKVMNIYGVLNDTTSVDPFMLKMTIDSLPLNVANPFLYDAGVSLTGCLDGEIKVTGEPSSPVFNGSMDFNNAGVDVMILGTTYVLSDKKIPIDSGIVKFDNYEIKAVNDNPLRINGTLNMRNVLDPKIDLSLIADEIQLIGSDRARGRAEVYGKLFANLEANAKGNLKLLNINAKADILNTTDVSYVMIGGAQSVLASRNNSNLVKFVNFANPAMVNEADSIKLTGMLMKIKALLSISRGAELSVDLSSDGKNKVQLEPSGNLDYTMDILGGQHLIGRLNIDDGFARYTPPLMSEKLFSFQEGSYVEFNGNILNPILNIHTIDKVKANVTQEGQNSRLIYFNVGLDITGTLENMDVAFDLSTDDDITVANELESMSPSQRASKAMNLLLTNTYTGLETTADANMGTNALYSFLSSTLNSWVANNIKGVDLTFGVNQYENTTDGISSQATSYSYNVSKSLLDDRFKISVGGNYTTDADPNENLTQNLVSDIAVEYMLNKNGTMYVKIFRHVGFKSILEGEIVQTGVGLTYRKRMNSLKHMFHLLPRKHNDKEITPKEKEADNEKENPISPEEK